MTAATAGRARRLAAALAAISLSLTASVTGCQSAFQHDTPGPGRCKPGYHHRLANQDPLGPWCVRNGSSPW